MRVFHTKIGILLIAGMVFTAVLAVGFGIPVFAGDPVEGLEITIEQIPGGRVSNKYYNSSRSSKSIGQIRMEVGDILLRYGIGGADINKVTDALEGNGVYETELKSFLVAIGVNEVGVQEVITKLNELDINADSSTDPPSAAEAVPAPAAGKDYNESKSNTKSAPAGETPRPTTIKEISGIESETEIIEIKDGDDMIIKKIELMQNTIGKIQERLKGCDTKVCITVGNHAGYRAGVATEADKAIEAGKNEEAIQSLRAVKKIVEGDIELLAAVEDKGLIADVLGLERALLHQTDSALTDLQRSVVLLPAVQPAREAAKALRDNFRENVKITIGHVDHGKTARIAVAHGKGLRMLNRYRSAMARFDHILARLESRIEKMRIEIEAEERASNGTIETLFPPTNMAILIEEAKNMSVENEAKMEELKAKYESLLLGENAGGIAAEARALATELKTDIENLRAIIIEIYTQADDYNSSRSNTSI